MSQEEIFRRVKWLQSQYGTDLMLFFLVELIAAHNDYNFEDMFKELVIVIERGIDG